MWNKIVPFNFPFCMKCSMKIYQVFTYLNLANSRRIRKEYTWELIKVIPRAKIGQKCRINCFSLKKTDFTRYTPLALDKFSNSISFKRKKFYFAFSTHHPLHHALYFPACYPHNIIAPVIAPYSSNMYASCHCNIFYHLSCARFIVSMLRNIKSRVSNKITDFVH